MVLAALVVVPAGPPGVGHVGYGILPEFRGRGFTARTLDLVADWLFTHAGLHRLELGHKAPNAASGGAAVRGGFTVEGTLARRLRNADGSTEDEVFYGRTR